MNWNPLFYLTLTLNQCNVIQPSFQFPLNFVYEDSIPDDDISRTVKEVVEGVNVLKYFDFSHIVYCNLKLINFWTNL